jgi:O-antigen ligase
VLNYRFKSIRFKAPQIAHYVMFRRKIRRKTAKPERLSETAPVDPKEKRRKWTLYFALALIFIRFSMIHQILANEFHLDLYLLYVVGIPVLIGLPLTGGFSRALQYRSLRFWILFALWLIPSSLLSSWKGGSFSFLLTYYRTELILLFAIAGLVVTWEECRWVFYSIAGAAVINILSIVFFGQTDENGRRSLSFETIANSNDYAGHLIFVTPFVLWVALTAKSFWLRLLGFMVVAFGLYQILASASRGALLGIVAALILLTISAGPKVRRKVLIAAPITVVVAFMLMPKAAVTRIFSFSESSAASSDEALESSRIREQLLRDSVRMTFEHPLFGVGLGQFSANEGSNTMPGLGFSLYLQPHNSYMQIASENGIPGLLFYLGALFSLFSLLSKTNQACAGKPKMHDISMAVLCLRISLTGFCVAIFFLNFGYFFYLPTMSGISIAVAAASGALTPVVETVRKALSANPLMAAALASIKADRRGFAQRRAAIHQTRSS